MYLSAEPAVQAPPPQEFAMMRQQLQLQQRQQQKEHTVFNESHLERLPLERAADFAAQLTSYLWFRDAHVHYHPHSHSHFHPHHHHQCQQHQSMSPFAFGETRVRGSFTRFCRDVISATQVSHSVVALSLLYISRMKKRCPPIQGHPGSEFRAFTVALMLANKFLDDNTYTNKTWSEVTNIPVREINIMEMEFLSALEFTLYVSFAQYYEWVYELDQYVPRMGGNGHDDDGSVPGSRTAPHHQAQIVPQLIVETALPVVSTSAAGFKRSAHQAFDATTMVTSPPKRTNSATGSYPVYHHHHHQESSQVTSAAVPPPPPPQQLLPQQLPQSRLVQTSRHQPHQPRQPVYLTFTSNGGSSSSSSSSRRSNSSRSSNNSSSRSSNSSNSSSSTLFRIPPTASTIAYATSYAQPQYTLDPMNVLYTAGNYYSARPPVIPVTTVSFPTTVM